MTERTPEFVLIHQILTELDNSDREFTENEGVSRLAAPLEAANKRIKELEAELAPLRQFVGNNLVMSDYRTADDMRAHISRLRNENHELREAVRVLAVALKDAKSGLDYVDRVTNRMYGVGWLRVQEKYDNAQSNPTAKAAIEAARKENR